LLDALVEARFDRKAMGALGEADARRADALVAMFGLMEDYPVDDAEDALVHATLARIDRHEAERSARLKFDARQDAAAGPSGGARGRRMRIPDLITVAAIILIAVSVFWPMLTSARQRATDQACANNLRLLGYGFSNYAADNNGAMPIAMAGLPGFSQSGGGGWDKNVRHTLNLEPLVQGGYCEVGHFNCPGHHHSGGGVATGPSYSYRWHVPGAPIGWGTQPHVTVVLGDLNPMIDAARSGMVIPPLSMSPNHGGRGQNVLVSDGATMWLTQPIVGPRNDNIWLPNGTDQLRRGLRPDDPMDVFLAH
jgi:hypothetical protein